MLMGAKRVPVITACQSEGGVSSILTDRYGGRRYCMFLILILIASVEKCNFRLLDQSKIANQDGSLAGTSANRKIEDLTGLRDGTAYWRSSMRGVNKIFKSYYDFGSGRDNFGSGRNNNNKIGDEILTRVLMGVGILSEDGFYVLPATWFCLIDANNYPVGSMEKANTVKNIHYFGRFICDTL